MDLRVPQDFPTLEIALRYALEGDRILVSRGYVSGPIIFPAKYGITIIGGCDPFGVPALDAPQHQPH